MDDGKRKKKNKKNKSKPTRTVDNVDVIAGEMPVTEDNHGSSLDQNHQIQNSGIMDNSNTGMSESETELERRKIDEAKHANLEEKIEHLQHEMDSYIQKEASLQKKIEHLLCEHDSLIQKEASWYLEIEHFRGEINSLNLKEASLEDKVKHLESEKDSWILKENSIKEMMARLEEVNLGLQMQVKELEEFRDGFVQENHRLVESITVMESRVQHLERDVSFFRSSNVKMTKHLSEDKNPLNQMEPAHELVERPVSEIAQLGKKVNEPYFELDHTNAAQHSSMTGYDPATEQDINVAPTDSLSESDENIVSKGSELETVSIDNVNMDLNANAGVQLQPKELPTLDEASRSEEIVQVSLDVNQVQEVESQLERANEKTGVPLSDAPLIGAPFRLISFVAKFVTGADLVKENSPASGR